MALTTLAASPWAYVVMAGILIIDGFFPFVPGETGVVTLAALGAAGHGPNVWIVLGVAIVATMIGDAIAFAIGRTIGIRRWRWMRGPRVSRAFEWAAAGLLRRPTVFLMVAKFVPFARVAVTMTAAAGRLPIRRYLPISFAASTFYTGYHVIVAVIAGKAFASMPLLGAAIAIVAVILFGALFEVVALRTRRREERATPPPDGTGTAWVDPASPEAERVSSDRPLDS
ncbi:DedA family protein [Lysinimonas soli]|uniref:DedA family protein n=1 Tax=Lysinimonas soli TaxID=1074233 RepID=A0ABW0NMA7_9MICO